MMLPLGDVLSITTGCLVSRDGMEGVYRILNHMTGDDLFTHQLPRASDECRGPLLDQHPHLADIVTPEFDGEDSVYAWLASAEAKFGAELEVAPLDPSDHTSIDPMAELGMKAPHLQVLTVEVPDAG